jgi:hypothetical protein
MPLVVHCVQIFAFFICYDATSTAQGSGDSLEETSFLTSDFRISCQETAYMWHFGVCLVLIATVPLGVPFVCGFLIWHHRDAIGRHHGPAHLESLYGCFKPERCLWETYFLTEKAILIGLLSFLDRGSVLQSLVGMTVSNCMLLATAKATPYLSLKTNILSVFGQAMICAAYYSSILLRIDLKGELISHNTIGAAILLANAPMALYFIYDTWITLRDQLHDARIGVLRDELLGVGAVYRCIHPNGVNTSKTMRKQKPVFDLIQEGEIITAIGQSVLFTGGGAVGRLQTANKGWVSYNDQGLVGHRHFVAVSTPDKQGDDVGSVWLTVQQLKMERGQSDTEGALKAAHRAAVKLDVAITEKEKLEAQEEKDAADAELLAMEKAVQLRRESESVKMVLVTVQHAELLSAAELQAEAQETALREELSEKKLSALQNRARQAGIDEAEVEWATDHEDAPLVELTNLIVNAEVRATIDKDKRIGVAQIEVSVNGVDQKTASARLRTMSGCQWNDGQGETLAFEVAELETVYVKAYFTETEGTGAAAMVPASDGVAHPVGVAQVNLDQYLERDDEWTAVFREDTEPFAPVLLRGELGEVGATIMSARDLEELRYADEKLERKRQQAEEKAGRLAQKKLLREEKAAAKKAKAEQKAARTNGATPDGKQMEANPMFAANNARTANPMFADPAKDLEEPGVTVNPMAGTDDDDDSDAED